MQEDVAIVGVLFFVDTAIFFTLHDGQSSLDEAVDKSVDLLSCALGFFGVGQEVQLLESGPLRAEPLRLVEVVGKLVIHVVFYRCYLAVDTLAKQELRSRVDSKAEEDGLNVGVPGPTSLLVDRKSLHSILNMTFFQIQLTDLIPSKLRSQQASRPRPSFPVSGELLIG